MKADMQELRESELARRTHLEFARIYNAVKAGDKPTMKALIDAMGDLVADDQVMGDLILAALGDRMKSGIHLSGLISVLIESEAEIAAEAQVVQLERDSKADPENDPRWPMREPP